MLGYMYLLELRFFSGYMPSSVIGGSYGRFIPSFLRNLHSVLHNVCISLHSHQQCRGVAFSLHSLQHMFPFFWRVVWFVTSVLYFEGWLSILSTFLQPEGLRVGEGDTQPLFWILRLDFPSEILL